MRSGRDGCDIVEQDCGVRVLESIIEPCDFLVGPWAHSLIGGVSIGMPFAALTNQRDTGTHRLSPEICRCKNQIVDMNVLDERAAARKAFGLFESRRCVRRAPGPVREKPAERVSRTARLVKGATLTSVP
jgi:hypothetical protein